MASKKKMVLGREAILGAQDVVVEEVAVPEWGGVVYARGMTGRERAQYETSLVNVKDGRVAGLNTADSYALLALYGTVDGPDPATAQRLFTDEDLEALRHRAGAPLARIARVVLRLSGMNKEAQERMAEDFLGSQRNGSGTD